MSLLNANELAPGGLVVPWREQTRVQQMRGWQLWSAGVWSGIGTDEERKRTGADAIWRWTPPLFRFVEQFYAGVVVPDVPVVTSRGCLTSSNWSSPARRACCSATCGKAWSC